MNRRREDNAMSECGACGGAGERPGVDWNSCRTCQRLGESCLDHGMWPCSHCNYRGSGMSKRDYNVQKHEEIRKRKEDERLRKEEEEERERNQRAMEDARIGEEIAKVEKELAQSYYNPYGGYDWNNREA